MIYLLCFLVVIVVVLIGFTLLRPKSCWGRLAFLFIPKLFSGTFIVIFELMGLVCALFGWFVADDLLALVLGLLATAIASRHV